VSGRRPVLEELRIRTAVPADAEVLGELIRESALGLGSAD
jgi:hypothetical protein